MRNFPGSNVRCLLLILAEKKNWPTLHLTRDIRAQSSHSSSPLSMRIDLRKKFQVGVRCKWAKISDHV